MSMITMYHGDGSMMTVLADADRYVRDVVGLLGEDIHFWLGPIEIGGETCIADLPSIVYASGEFNFTGHKDLREEVRVGRSVERQRALLDRVKNLLNDDCVLIDASNSNCPELVSSELAPTASTDATELVPTELAPTTSTDATAPTESLSAPETVVAKVSEMAPTELGKRKIFIRTLYNASPEVKRSR